MNTQNGTFKTSDIRPTNIQSHIDIEKEIANIKDGQLTFTLRINGGNVADIAVVEYIDVRDIIRLKSVIIEEFTTTRTN